MSHIAVDKAKRRTYAIPMHWDDEIDAIGLLCPLPVLKARKRLSAMAPGRVLRLLASDAMARIDVPLFCREAGHELIAQFQAGDVTTYLIRRGPK